MITGNFTISQSIKDGWKLTKKHWIVMIGIYLGYLILNMLIALIMNNNFGRILSTLISVYFSMSYLKMYLVASNDEEPEFNVFGKMAKRFLPFLGGYLLYIIGITVGLCLLIVPGIWFGVRFSMALNLITDNEQIGVIEAFKKSYEITSGHAFPLIGLFLCCILLIIGGLICLIVGVLLAYVWVGFTQVAAFRLLMNENKAITDTDTTITETTGSETAIDKA